MPIRLALGHLEGFDETVSTFARQLGLTSVQFHTPSDLAAATATGRSMSWSACASDARPTGWSWRASRTSLTPIGTRSCAGCPAARNSWPTTAPRSATWPPPGSPSSVTTSCPPTCGAPTCTRRGRGGARVTAFDAARVGEGNALAGYKLTPDETFAEPIGSDRMWDNYRVFLEAVLPVAEEVGVRLALHPDDPPTDIPLGGITRILTSPEALERAGELSAAARPGGSTCVSARSPRWAGPRPSTE